jgi:hypothetical protein
MKKLALFLAVTSLAAAAHAQTPAATPSPLGTSTTPAAAATPKPKPLAEADKKFIKDVSEAVLIEQKYLALVVDNKTATFSEETKRATGPTAGELKRIWTALATLATTKGAPVAQEASKMEQPKVDRLAKEKPDKFEKEFFKEFGKETKKTAKIFDSAKTLMDADVKKFADDWTVTIKGHDATVEATEKQLAAKKK